MNKKVSVIVPTFNRQHLFPLVLKNFAAQNYENLELLVFDDSDKPSLFFEDKPDIRYFYSPNRVSIGEKRNLLVGEASGEIIVHFDDDDYYAPSYISRMTNKLSHCDVAHLTGWFVYNVSSKTFGYWQTDINLGFQFLFQAQKPLGLLKGMPVNDSFVRGYGFSYVYKKSVWEKTRFPDKNFGEDYDWVKSLSPTLSIKNFLDDEGLVLHILHQNNTSRCFPQYLLPTVLLARLFGTQCQDFIVN